MASFSSTRAKLKQVRQVMQNVKACEIKMISGPDHHFKSFQGMDAFLIGTADAHQSEYVSARDKRREWITGFTGSAGSALITQDQALLWTDGRYYLQAEKELDAADWTIMKSDQPNVLKVEEWIAKNLVSGMTLGIDPLLTNVSLMKKLVQSLEQQGATLVMPEKNPIDTVWTQAESKQPAISMAKCSILDEQYTGASISEKLENVRRVLNERQVTATVFTALDDIAWLFNLRGTDIEFNPVCLSYALITLTEAYLFIYPEKVDAAAREHLALHEVQIQSYDNIFSQIHQHCQEGTTPKISIDTTQCNLAIYQAIPAPARVEQRSIVWAQKAIKNAVEIEGMRQAHVKDGLALVRFFSWLEAELKNPSSSGCISEVDAAEKQASFRQQMNDFVSLSFDTISSIGPNGAIIHYKPESSSCSMLNTHELYLNDSGGQYLDGTTDVTRTVHFGSPTDYEKECFTYVLKAHIALATAVFPDGVDGMKLDTLTRAPLWKAGLDYAHGTGHGVGAYLNVHEKGVLLSFRSAPTSTYLGISKGMIISNEPGYYEDGAFGIRIESLMVIHEAKSVSQKWKKYCAMETITMVPIQLSLINATLLTTDEIQWLNDYHRRVFENIRPLLNDNIPEDAQALAYLTRSTAPLSAS